jgi:hypothetical protein
LGASDVVTAVTAPLVDTVCGAVVDAVITNRQHSQGGGADVTPGSICLGAEAQGISRTDRQVVESPSPLANEDRIARSVGDVAEIDLRVDKPDTQCGILCLAELLEFVFADIDQSRLVLDTHSAYAVDSSFLGN